MRWMLGVLLLCVCSHLEADEGTDFLRKFRANPRQWMDRPLAKYRRDGTRIDKLRQWPKRDRAFRENDAEIKNTIDKRILGEGKQGWEAHDSPRHLFEAGVDVETNITRLPEQGELTHTPWSAYYWPIARGGVSMRYADPSYMEMLEEEEEEDGLDGSSYERVISHYKQPEDFLALLRRKPDSLDEYIDRYSPAEKYDLLVGSSDFALTNLVKEKGRRYMDDNGNVDSWMGICHGWAIAAYASPRPAKQIAVKSVDGRMVNFHPDDLRALVSLKWASPSWGSLFVGGRCNASDSTDEEDEEDDTTEREQVRKDEETGRILNPECFDTNPGTWHVVVTNKIGRHDQAFIMDATFDTEVWNQPVHSYKVSWYHPRTDLPGTLADSVMPIDAEWRKEDTFAKFRKNPKAKKIVVVKMDVTYVNENLPRHGASEADALTTVRYYYDLELDANNNIVGGEWLTNRHPDFLWTKLKNARPQNTVDRAISRLIDEHKTVRKFAASKDMSVFNKAMLGRLAKLAGLSLQLDDTPLELVLYGLVEMAAQR